MCVHTIYKTFASVVIGQMQKYINDKNAIPKEEDQKDVEVND
jgi:hypothetical protein